MNSLPAIHSQFASDLYSKSHGKKNEGKERCHWCSAACTRQYVHDDVTPAPFVVSKEKPRLPGNPWSCFGCFTFRRKRLTVTHLDGYQLDVQSPQNHSWLLTGNHAHAVRKSDHQKLAEFLLRPTADFALMLTDNPPIHLHLGAVNKTEALTIGTPLRWTFNDLELTYTIYELEEAWRRGTSGKEPGSRRLAELLGKVVLPAEVDPTANRVGKPPQDDDGRKLRRKPGEKG